MNNIRNTPNFDKHVHAPGLNRIVAAHMQETRCPDFHLAKEADFRG